jgi:hypothetical protein
MIVLKERGFDAKLHERLLPIHLHEPAAFVGKAARPHEDQPSDAEAFGRKIQGTVPC